MASGARREARTRGGGAVRRRIVAALRVTARRSIVTQVLRDQTTSQRRELAAAMQALHLNRRVTAMERSVAQQAAPAQLRTCGPQQPQPGAQKQLKKSWIASVLGR